MPSSLANQLAQGVSLNASLLADRSRRKPVESYLFTGREADQHDLESIHALGSNGLIQLRALDKRFGSFGETLFSDSSKSVDRTLQSKEANARLDGEIEQFLSLLGPFLLDTPAGKVLEWLVRRFRINEFNVDAILSAFVPYHEAPHFVKMLSILHISTQSVHAYLLPSKSSTLPVARQTVVVAMRKHADVLRFISSLLPSALERGTAHRVLVSFNTVIVMDYLGRADSNTLAAGSFATLIPALTAPLNIGMGQHVAATHRDAMVGSYMLLATISHSTPLTPAAVHGVIAAMASCAHYVSMKTFLRSASAFCSPQKTPDAWSDQICKILLNQSSFIEELVDLLSYTGAETFVQAFLPYLVAQLPSDAATAALNSFISSTKTPTALMRTIALSLLLQCVAPDAHGLSKSNSRTEVALSCRQMLVAIQQRLPSVLEAVVAESCNDGELKDATEQLIISLSMTQAPTGSKAHVNLVVASTNADSNIRAIAVRDLYKLLDSRDISFDEMESVRSALRTRVQDTSQAVLVALYTEVSKLSALLSSDVEGFISTLAGVIHPAPPIPTPPRAIIRMHLDFLVLHFLPVIAANKPDLREIAFEKIIFPLLLLSKPRLKTARVAWSVLSTDAASHGLAALPLVAAALDAYNWEISRTSATPTAKDKRSGPDTEPEITIESMARVNIAVAARMAEAILAVQDYDHQLSFVLGQLQAPSPHARGLAYLILRALLGSLAGERQIDIAERALAAMELNSLEEISGFMTGVDNLQALIDDASLGTAVALKPSSKTTLSRLQAAAFALIPLIPRPPGVSGCWLGDSSSETLSVNERYVQLMRNVYSLANATSNLPLLSTNILRALFITLASDTLAFLAGVWLSSPKDEVAHAALCHAVAFFAAHGEVESCVDFQTMLPALFLALQSESKNVREAAAECIVLMLRMTGAKKAASVYAIDSIYGDNTDRIQFLEWADFGRYLSVLVEHKDHLIGDGTYLPNLHRHALSKQKGDGKKDLTYKQRVVCYLLSHASATSLPSLQIMLLRALSEVSSPLKAQLLLSDIQWVCTTSREDQIQAKGKVAEEHAVLLLSSFDASICQTLNEPATLLWETFLDIIRGCYRPGFFASASSALSHRIEHGLYSGLKPERKIEVCRLLLSLASESTTSYALAKQTLTKVLGEVPVIIQLLASLRPLPASAGSPRVAKRARLDSAALDQNEDPSSSLGLLAEVLAGRDLPSSQELVSSLLETLGALVHLESADTDYQYVQQLLMTAVETAASKMSDVQNPKSASIRVDLLVDLIRSADNPQTFNQALLLISTLSKLSPESVLHNIMPIFTFMGSNVFHRDDAYSFQVVQKTIDGIIPVMVSSLRQKSNSRLEVQIQSRELLRIFTDAAHHIPRHRRTNFFGHLVDVLGPADFLSPTCLLVVDKVANRILRQEKDDVQASLSLALSILQRYPASVQVQALVELLDEAERHVLCKIGTDDALHTFLETMSDEDNTTTTTATVRRVQAIVLLVGHALDNSPAALLAHSDIVKDDLRKLVSTLLRLISLPTGGVRSEYEPVASTAQSTLTTALTRMSTQDFLSSTLGMVQLPDTGLQIGALALISQLLPNVSDKARQEVTQVVKDITEVILSDVDAVPRTASYSALRAITVTMSAGEEGPLMKAVPLVLSSVRTRMDAPAALALLHPLAPKLGPRMIPHFHAMVEECVAFLRDEPSDSAAWNDALGVLSSLLQSIPTFWGKSELNIVLKLYVEDESPRPALNAFIRSLTKRVPSKTLLPALCDAWTTLQISGPEDAAQRAVGYFQVMKRALHAAPRPDISEHLRPLFKVFMDGLSRREALQTWENDEAEAETIAAFLNLVVKLNEATFRPLFRRMFDWAFAGKDSDGEHFRALTFCRVYEALLDYFKGLMMSYTSFLIQPFIDLLKSFETSDSEEDALWLALLSTLTKSLQYDEGAFWRADKLRQISTTLVAQVATCVQLGSAEGKSTVADSLVALADATDDDALLKSLNLGILMHTRSDEVYVRIYALDCAEKLWNVHGSKLLGFVAETAGFMAECAEDSNDSVVQNAHKLKAAVESVAGSVHGL